MKHFIMITASVLALGGTLTACSSEPVKAPVTEAEMATETARLNAWFEEKFQEGVRDYPEYLASLGIRERMDEWNDPTRAFELEQLDEERQNLAEMKENFDFDKLSEDAQLSYRLFERNVNNSLDGDKYHDYGYPFNQMFGIQSGIPTFMLNRHRIDNVEDARNYIARLNGVKDVLDVVVARSEQAAEKGIMPPKFVYGHVIRDSKNVLTGAPFEETDELNLLLADFETKVKKLDLPEDEQEALYTDAITALLTSVRPAYENLIATLESQEARTTTDDGVWKLPDGADYYANRLKMMTTTDMTASEIHDLGLAEVDRIHGEMRDIMTAVEFEGDLQDFFEFMRTDEQFVYPNTEAGKAAYLAEATRMIDVMYDRLPEVFNTMPKAGLEVVAVEAFREKSAGKAFYNRPAQDGSRPGRYYANLYDMNDMPKYQMEALAYHEGVPGHHMQLSIAQELEGVPSFRKYGRVTAYTEGWGLYSEYLPKEMGFYADPYSDFGRLAMELWRAARLVVDTGLHDKRWSREKAIEYLTTNTPNPEGDCIKAIERYIVMPGQATAYKIGMIKILELREEAKATLGDKFDLGAFHDVVLASGPVPLNILEDRVNTWVKSQG
ncbi:DUF885 family protein [Fretibacter rubidus]|uniref:DUF885 domain-containing protein n=1 Tax=Fretibacter rubidus TaxID=570162 RepID=UPI00352B5EA1